MGDGSADEGPRNRLVLGDVTNQLGKRRFVSIQGNSLIDNSGKNVENESGRTKFARKISSGAENSYKGKCDSEFSANDAKIGTSSIKGDKPCRVLNLGNDAQFPQGKSVSSVSGFPDKIKEFSGLLDGNRLLVLSNSLTPRAGERGKSQNSSSSSLSVGEDHHEQRRLTSESTRNTTEASEPDKNATTHVFGENVEEMDGADLNLNIYGSTACSIPSGSSVPKVSESQMCAGFSNDGCSNSSADMDFLKTCSCSLCRQAAFMWSDLHYQDAKCRLAAIKKSKKEFRTVIERDFSHGEAETNGQENPNKIKSLEFDLSGQWRSLFLHTEKILARENAQLQLSIVKLKDLRDNCKADLQTVHSVPSNK